MDFQLLKDLKPFKYHFYPKEFFYGFFLHLSEHFIPKSTNYHVPHLLSARMSGLLAGLLVSMKIFILTFTSFSHAAQAQPLSIDSANLIAITNASRKQFGLSNLQQNEKLAIAAQLKAEDMVKNGYFSHNSPSGLKPWDFIKTAGYDYLIAAENLAVNYQDAEFIGQAWISSPAHKANILNQEFKDIGVGVAIGEYSGKNAIFVVQMFGTAQEQRITLQAFPTNVITHNPSLPTMEFADGLSEYSKNNYTLIKRLSPNERAILNYSEKESLNIDIKPSGEFISMEVSAYGDYVKILAVSGQSAFMLYPNSQQVWETKISLSKLQGNNGKLTIKAFDIENKIVEKTAANINSDILLTYNPAPQVAGQRTDIMTSNAQFLVLEKNFYMFVIVGILVAMVIGIISRWKIYHLSTITNGSLVTMLAIFLWLGS